MKEDNNGCVPLDYVLNKAFNKLRSTKEQQNHPEFYNKDMIALHNYIDIRIYDEMQEGMQESYEWMRKRFEGILDDRLKELTDRVKALEEKIACTQSEKKLS